MEQRRRRRAFTDEEKREIVSEAQAEGIRDRALTVYSPSSYAELGTLKMTGNYRRLGGRFSLQPLAITVYLLATMMSVGTGTRAQAHDPLVVDGARFEPAGLVREPREVDCTFIDDAPTRCLELVVKNVPDGLTIGPFCPRTLSDIGGIWNWNGEQPGLYRLDGEFFRMLDRLGFTFHDETGIITIVDPATVAPPGAAGFPPPPPGGHAGPPPPWLAPPTGGHGPDREPNGTGASPFGSGPPDPGPRGHACLEATRDDSVEITVLLPIQPERANRPTALGTVAKVGLALNGTPIFADAPTVIDTGNLPAMDTCGGHIDPGGWYHWHGTATDIETPLGQAHIDARCHLPQSASTMFGYALDGYPLYGSREADGSVPEGLDDCRGHIGQQTPDFAHEVYHYHAGEGFPNLPPCLTGKTVVDNFATTARTGIGSHHHAPSGGRR